MGFIKRLSLICILALSFVSCKNDVTDPDNNYAYLGGEIINPRKDFVILSKSERVLDTVILDANNRFLYKIENLEDGLYTFKLPAAEGLEYQMVLLEPRDSIMFRLNTLEFDESLVYTGYGAKKNNYLINLFLDGEAEDKTILSYSQLPADEFERRLDSIRDLKLKKLKTFNANNTTSPIHSFSLFPLGIIQQILVSRPVPNDRVLYDSDQRYIIITKRNAKPSTVVTQW